MASAREALQMRAITTLVRSPNVGATLLAALVTVGQGSVAQTAPSPLSGTERKATFEQALRHRQAGKYRDAFDAFALAGNAGDRRAATWAAMAYEEGIGRDANAEIAAEWHVIAAMGGLNRNIPLQIEWLGDGAIRYHVKPDHQRVTMRADSSWTRELLHERIRVKDGAQALEGQESPEYVIDENADGNVTVYDWRGNWWSLDAPDPVDRLTRDAQTGDLTFTDDLKRTITVRQNGRRTVILNGGKLRRELDLGGRVIGEYDAGGKATNQYAFRYSGTAEPPVLNQFIGDKGALWGLTALEGGGQRWTLLNGDDPSKPVHMDVRIGMNRANSLVFEDGDHRRINSGDGSEIDESRRREPSGAWITEKKVGDRSKQGDSKPGDVAYALITYERDSIFKQELKSSAGHFVRGGEGQDFLTASWWEVDKSGLRKAGRVSAGDIFIDDNGTLIKRGYASEPDPARPGDVRIMRDKRGNAIVEAVTYVYTSGETEQWFSHGGVIRRDHDGDVLWTVTPAGEITRYYYTGEGEGKEINGVREGANPRWAWVNHFASRSPSRDNLATASSIDNVSVNRRTGDAVWEDTEEKTRTTYRVDGSRQYVTGDEKSQRVIEIDSKGRTTRFLTPVNKEFKLYYADDGRLERVDHDADQGYSIVEPGYQAPSGLPLTAKQVLRGTKLEFLGWGDERYVSFLNTEGNRVNFWGGATIEEHAGEANAPLVRVVLRGDFTVSRKPGDALSNRVTPVETIDDVSGEGWDKSVIYTDSQRRRFQRFSNGALSELDAAGRPIEHRDGSGRVFKFGYSAAIPGTLESASTPQRTLRRGSLPSGVVDLHLTSNRILVVTLAAGFEIYDLQDGTMSTIDANGTLSRFDHRDRLSYQEEHDGKTTGLLYDGEGTTPAKRLDLGSGMQAKPDGKATLDVALERGRLLTLQRTTKAPDGTATKKLIARLEGSEWIDEERRRYSSAWVSQTPRRVFLASDHGRFIRIIHHDGAETLVHFDDRYETRSRVVRNARDEVAAVKHADQSITRFERHDAGRIVLLQQGPDLLVLQEQDGQVTVSPSISPDTRLRVSFALNSRGDQAWTGRNGTKRTVAADGTVTIERSDGSKTIHSSDRSSGYWSSRATRHLFPSRVGARIVEVADFHNGDVEWIYSDRTVGRHAAHGIFNEHLDKDRTPSVDQRGRPNRWRGQAAVSPSGDLARLTLEPKALVVEHADGAATVFANAGENSWKDPRTGEVFPGSWPEVAQRLMALGATVPGVSHRHQDFARTEGVQRYRLPLGMFELEAAIARPARSAQRGPVSFVTRKKWDRPLASVMLSPEGKPQITYAALSPPGLAPHSSPVPPKGSPFRPGDLDRPAQPQPHSAGGPGQRAVEATADASVPPQMLELANSGNLNAQFHLGLRYLKAGDKAKAREWLSKAANAGHPGAIITLKEQGD